MTVPASAPVLPQTAVSSIVSQCSSIKSQCASYITRLQNNNVSADEIFQALSNAVNWGSNLAGLRSIPNLDTTAQSMIPGYSGSLSADTLAVGNAIQGVINWVMANAPVDGSGFILCYKWNADGTRFVRSFTPAQTAGLVTALQGVQATIG